MTDAIISVENLGKKYRINHHGEKQRYAALRDVIAEKAKWLFRGRNSEAGSQTNSSSVLRPSSSEDFWALRGASFEVKRGEVVGIIGRNGAGKSTLLKILSRITEPTTGRVTLRGRVASLLEVGTGFHPELTGRENIFLNGAILGMTSIEIKRKFDEIVAFAEVEAFLDTPVKRYSSGMYVRLAFAVAAHLDPEILIIDEVLAVGDAEFQKKCLGKMHDVSRGGRTVLLVSHNMSLIAALCDRVVLLAGGSVEATGTPDKIIARMAGDRDLCKTGQYQHADPDYSTPTILAIHMPGIREQRAISCLDEVTIRVDVDCGEQPHMLLGIHVFNEREEQIIHSSTEFGLLDALLGRTEIQIVLPAGLLNVGRYECSFILGARNNRIFCDLKRIVSFEIEDFRPAVALTRHADWRGALLPDIARWTTLPERSQSTLHESDPAQTKSHATTNKARDPN